MLRGEIWYGVWPNDPKQTARPLLIVSNNYRNQATYIQDVIVVKLTSLFRKDGSKKNINPSEDFVVTLKKQTIIRCASIYAVEKKFLTSKILKLTLAQMNEIDKRLKTVLDVN